MNIDLNPFGLSLLLAGYTTIILFFLTFPLAYLLACRDFRFKPLVEAVTSLPLILPPTVLGFYLLLLFSPNGPIGGFFLARLGVRLVFSFTGMVIASCVYSLPFMVQQLKTGLMAIPRSLREASEILGKSTMVTIIRVILPNMKPALVSAFGMTFAHTMGEFGVVLMIGGSIPGKTKVASIALFDMTEALDFGSAHILALLLVGISLFILTLINLFNNRAGCRQKK